MLEKFREHFLKNLENFQIIQIKLCLKCEHIQIKLI